MISLDDLVTLTNLATKADIKAGEAIAVAGLFQRVGQVIQNASKAAQAAEAASENPPAPQIPAAVAAAIASAAPNDV